MAETTRRRENTSMMTTTSRSASGETCLSVCIVVEKISFPPCRFITEAWSEDIFQWISTREKQYGKIGRARARAGCPLSSLHYLIVRRHPDELLSLGCQQTWSNIQGNLRGKAQPTSGCDEKQVSQHSTLLDDYTAK